MLTRSRGLDRRSLAAIAELEREVVAADGGRLKLEWGVLETRDPELDQDLLWWEGDRLIGYAGLYAFGPPDVEVAGMVAPDVRRRGIGSALLAAARPLAQARGYTRLLLVTPAVSAAGAAFAASCHAELDHSEHFLVLGPTPSGPDRDADVQVRIATGEDREVVRRLLASAFSWEPPADFFDRPGDTSYVVEHRSVPVGTVRLSVHGQVGGIYGFAVDPSRQGRGIGRDVLERMCRVLRSQGCSRVTLEVATENAHALGLYLSVGFASEAGEDYWAVGL